MTLNTKERQLRQRKYLYTRYYELRKDRLFVRLKSFNSTNEFEIRYSDFDIDGKLSYEKGSNYFLIPMVITLLFGLFAFVSRFIEDTVKENNADLVWFGISFVLFILYTLFKERYWKLRLLTNSHLYILKSSPSPQRVIKFIETLEEQIVLSQVYNDNIHLN